MLITLDHEKKYKYNMYYYQIYKKKLLKKYSNLL